MAGREINNMADIIDIEERLKHEKKKKDEIERIKKVSLLKKFIECTQCMLKCAKCGVQMDLPEAVNRDISIPFRFCSNCQEEYEEYIKRQLGQGTPSYYWYNEKWMDIWRHWIEYQNAVLGYKETEEFKRLLRELQVDK